MFEGHDRNIQGAILMIVADCGKEISVIVGGDAWVGKTTFVKKMNSIKHFPINDTPYLYI